MEQSTYSSARPVLTMIVFSGAVLFCALGVSKARFVHRIVENLERQRGHSVITNHGIPQPVVDLIGFWGEPLELIGLPIYTYPFDYVEAVGFDSGVTLDDIRVLQDISSLKRVVIDEATIDSSMVASLIIIPGKIDVILSRCRISDDNLELLKHANNIRSVKVIDDP